MVRLCSSSPTRASILREHGVDFIQSKVDFDEESLPYTNGAHFVYHASKGKMSSALNLYGVEEMPLLTADTVVVSEDGEILRKAGDEDEAYRILERLSGSAISIVSSLHFHSKGGIFSDLSSTGYEFSTFESSDVERYIRSGEWRGKAGACMVEGFCKKYITSFRGLESTAMGLQIERLIPWLNL